MKNKTLVDINNIIEFLQKVDVSDMDMENKVKLSDYIGCWLDIEESLNENDFEEIDYKLYVYYGEFGDMFYMGNTTENSDDYYVSTYDLTSENTIYIIENAIEFTKKMYK